MAVGREAADERQRRGERLAVAPREEDERPVEPLPAEHAAVDIGRAEAAHPVCGRVRERGGGVGEVDENLPRTHEGRDAVAKARQVGGGVKRDHDPIAAVAELGRRGADVYGAADAPAVRS